MVYIVARAQNQTVLCPQCFLVPVGERFGLRMCPNGGKMLFCVKKASFKFAFVSSNPKQMRWDLTRVDKENWDVLWVADERQIFPEGTSLPINIILTKVE